MNDNSCYFLAATDVDPTETGYLWKILPVTLAVLGVVLLCALIVAFCWKLRSNRRFSF